MNESEEVDGVPLSPSRKHNTLNDLKIYQKALPPKFLPPPNNTKSEDHGFNTQPFGEHSRLKVAVTLTISY